MTTATAARHDRSLDQKDRDTYTQVVAALAMRVPGRTLDARMAPVLAYMADRAHCGQYAHPLDHAERRSTREGPVVVMVLDMVEGRIVHDAWDDMLTIEDGRLTIGRHVGETALDELSVAMERSIAATAARFGVMTHDGFLAWARIPGNLPEWSGDDGDIALETILEAVGLDAATVVAAAEQDRDMRGLSLAFEETRLGLPLGSLPRPSPRQEIAA